MTDKKQKLVYILQKENRKITGKELSNYLNVTPRTIRNYIHAINEENPKQKILGSRTGYYIEKKIHLSKNYSHTSLPQNDKERFYTFIKILLNNKLLNCFDLCEEWHISYSTLQRSINFGNRLLVEWNLKVRINHQSLILDGTELNKRNYFIHLLYIENSQMFFKDEYLSNIFGAKQVQSVQLAIDKIIKLYNFEINEFAYNTLILNILVILSRNNNHTHLNQTLNLSPYTIDVISNLEKVLLKSLDTNDQIQIDALLKNSLDSHQSISKKEIPINFSKKIKKIIKQTENNFSISLDSPDFSMPLTLHINQLIHRCKSGKPLNNPFTSAFQNKSPLIFDIATFMADLIQTEWHIKINENEITFIVMHISAELRRNYDNNNKLNAIVICPDYLNMQESVENYLKKNFFSEIIILHVITNKEAKIYNFDNYDVIFTLENDINQLDPKFINLDIANLEENYLSIKKSLNQLLISKKISMLSKSINSIFPDSLFFKFKNTSKSHINKEQILKIVTQKMVDENYAFSDFYKKILYREKLSSTSFNNIAIPHPTDFSGNHTTVSVILTPDYIKWGNNNVNIIFMISIAKNKHSEFKKIFEIIIELLNDSKCTEDILKCSNMKDFKDIFIKNI